MHAVFEVLWEFHFLSFFSVPACITFFFPGSSHSNLAALMSSVPHRFADSAEMRK